MIIEQGTNYAYKLQYMTNPTFDKVRELSVKFYHELPNQMRDELFEALNRGIDILVSEPQMDAYMHAFGKMHQAKLEYAFDKLPDVFLEKPEINIIDYGCGQALGTMCYADFLQQKGCEQKVKTITLIEPSKICLKRAALHSRFFFPYAEIKTANKSFDELTATDFTYREETPTLHILSNVLDMLDFDLEALAGVIRNNICGHNQFVCVGPFFNFSDKDKRIEKFSSLLNGNTYYNKCFDKNEFVEDKAWTANIVCFSIVKSLSTEATEEDKENGVKDKFVIYSKDGKKLLGVDWRYYDDFFEDLCDCVAKDSPEHLDFVSFWDVVTPEKYTIKYGTEIICDGAFESYWDYERGEYHSSVIDDITIPDTVIYIGESSFDGCELQQLFIPNSVEKIGHGAFSGNEKLQKVMISDSVKTIGDWAFSNCYSLKQIILSDSITKIGERTFSGCKSLQHITIPNLVAIIEDYAFDGCTSLKQIEIPNSLTEIGEFAFWECSSIRLIHLSRSVAKIGYRAFGGCSSLIQVAIPNPFTHIEHEAFDACISLRQIIIPQGSIEKFKKMLPKELWDKLYEYGF